MCFIRNSHWKKNIQQITKMLFGNSRFPWWLSCTEASWLCVSGKTGMLWTGGCFLYLWAVLAVVSQEKKKKTTTRVRDWDAGECQGEIHGEFDSGVLVPVPLSPSYSLALAPWQACLHGCDSTWFCLSWLGLWPPVQLWLCPSCANWWLELS